MSWRPRTYLGQLLLTAGLYALAGRAALLMAIPPGYATAVWPAAGIALTCVLVLGNRVWPGIVVGSFLVNVWTSFDRETTVAIARSVGLAFAIGAGAAGQALVGGWLVRPGRAGAAYPGGDREVLAYLLLGGPVACVVSPTVGVSTLFAAGAIEPAAVAENWFTWWVGDAIGVIVCAPLVLLRTPGRAGVGVRRRLSVTVPYVVMFAAVTAIFFRTSDVARARLALEFEGRAALLAERVKVEVGGSFEILHSLAAAFGGPVLPDRSAFREIVRGPLARHPAILALGWNPRVGRDRRVAFEAAVRVDGCPDFEISEVSGSGETARATDRPEYFPATFLEPSEASGTPLGFDVASEPRRRAALERARDSGEPAATAPVEVSPGSEDATGFIVFVPVYAHAKSRASVADRRASLLGYVRGVFRGRDLVDRALGSAPRDGIAIALVDDGRGEAAVDLHANRLSRDPSAEEPGAPRFTARFELAGRPLSISFRLTRDYLRDHRSWETWMVLTGGLLLTGLLGALLLVMAGGSARFEELLAQRTAALARAEERARAIVETAHDAFVAIDATGRIVDWNRAAHETFGWTRAEALGRAVAETILPVRHRDVQAGGLAAMLATGAAPVSGRRLELDVLHRDGREFPVELTITSLRVGDAWVSNAFLHDITVRKQGEAELLRRTAETEAANRELEAFTYAVSHDLRAPLRAMDGFAQALVEDVGTALPAEARDHVRRIRAAAQRMGTLIDALLELSRLSRAELRREHVSISALAHAVVAELRAGDPTRSVETVVAPDLWADGDPRLLRAVLQNLIGNAWKFTRGVQSARIEVGCEVESAPPTFFVRDNGAGFDAAYAGRLFAPFQRLHGAHEFEGTGVGLATVRRIVVRHGGAVRAEGAVGRGATIWFTLTA